MRKQDMNSDWIATARTLSQALPNLQRYAGATVVIKLGGHAMGSDEAMHEFARDLDAASWGEPSCCSWRRSDDQQHAQAVEHKI